MSFFEALDPGTFLRWISGLPGTRARNCCRQTVEEMNNKNEDIWPAMSQPGDCTLLSYTHLEGFDDDRVHFVMRPWILLDRELFISCDGGPGRDGPLHLLDFGFLILVAILQPVAKSSEKPFQSREFSPPSRRGDISLWWLPPLSFLHPHLSRRT